MEPTSFGSMRCRTEVAEVMRQVDNLIGTKKTAWDRQLTDALGQLQVRTPPRWRVSPSSPSWLMASLCGPVPPRDHGSQLSPLPSLSLTHTHKRALVHSVVGITRPPALARSLSLYL